MITSDDTKERTGFVTNASTPAQVSEFLQLQFPHLPYLQLATVNTLCPIEAPLPMHAAYFPSLAQAYGEAIFIFHGLEIGGYQPLYNSYFQVWNYRYNVEDAIYVALVPHVSENAAIFGIRPTGSGTGAGGSYTTYNAPIVPIMMNYFFDFIKYLDPNGIEPKSGATKWNNLGLGLAQQRLLFQLDYITMESVPVDQLKRCLFWDGVTSQTQT